MQQDEITNGIAVGTKRKAASESSDIINGSTEDDNGEKNHTREGKQKRKKKKHDEKIEKEEDKHGEDCIEEKKEAKRKRKNGEENLNVVSHFDEGVTSEEGKVESKKKKKKKSLVDNCDRTTIGKSSNSGNKIGLEEAVITNLNNKSEDQASNDALINGSSENDTAALNGDTTLSHEKNDQTLSSTVEKKVLRKAARFNGEPFAKFQKNSTPPAFVRKCLAKTPSTEPQKTKTSSKKVGNTFMLYSVLTIIITEAVAAFNVQCQRMPS